MMESNENIFFEFYKNKRVLITGHNGFKGTWLTRILLNAGAMVMGYSLKPPSEPALFYVAGIKNHPNFKEMIGDVRDLKRMRKVFDEFHPDIVLHLAAQPIVRESYKNPHYTYETNVMGTVNLFECIRSTLGTSYQVKSVLNVTTDKVYHNNEWSWGYRENDPLDGYDPYSNSKSCSELVTHSYRDSFFKNTDGSWKIPISTARAGNVIGGGDFAEDRIIPDCVRAMKVAYEKKECNGTIKVRNPYSIRPYQHVLEPLIAYLTIVMKQYKDPSYAEYYNIGPDDCDCITTGQLVHLFCEKWNDDNNTGVNALWEKQEEKDAPHEANFLKLDCSKIKAVFAWKPVWHIEECMKYTVDFTKTWILGNDIVLEMDREIKCFFEKL